MVEGMDDLTKLTELYISDCAELQELPSLARLNWLKRINIDSCEKLNSIILPMALVELTVQRCRYLKTVAAMGVLLKLTELYISECPELEDLPVRYLSCLKCITIKECERLKRLLVPDCIFLKGVSGLQFWISDCVELEKICLFSCKNLEKITLTTTLKSLHLDACPDLKSVSEISNLKNLVQLIISGCGALELELNLEGMKSLQNIEIYRCSSFKSVVLNRCEKLKRVSLSCSHKFVAPISVYDCPVLEFLSLGKTYGMSIFIYSCEKLENIEGMEESLSLKIMQLLYPSNAYIYCIPKVFENVPSEYLQIIGRAADGAKSTLNLSVLSEASFCTDEMQAVFKLVGYEGCIIICAVVEVNSSVRPFLEKFVAKGVQLQQGELIITTIITNIFGKMLNKVNEQFEDFDFLSKHRIMKKWCVGGVKIGEEWRTLNVLRTIIDKLHQK